MQEFLESVGAYMAFALLVIVPLWKVFDKAGLNHRLALLVFVPFIGWLGALGVLAFVRWPGNRLPDIRPSEERRWTA